MSAIAMERQTSDTEICENVASEMAATADHRETLQRLTRFVGERIPIEKLAGLEEWAAKQNPALQIPLELARRVEREGNPYGTWTLSQLPASAFYALHSVDGTMHCYNSIYFVITDDQIQLAQAPRGIQTGDGACMVSRKFTFIGESPVMVEEAYTQAPSMTSWLTIASWEKDRFKGSCRIDFEYEPEFKSAHATSMNCEEKECRRLQISAEKLVADVQRSPHDAWQSSLSAMNSTMRDRYLAATPLLEKLGYRTWESDPANLTEQSPIRLPHAEAEALYVVSIGHKTIGWRYFSDWEVVFHEIAGEQLVERAKFDVEMSKGAIKRWRATSR